MGCDKCLWVYVLGIAGILLKSENWKAYKNGQV